MLDLLKISEKLHSAFLLCAALSAVFDNPKKWLTLTQVADIFHLSQGYLEEIVASLRKAKIVVGKRGINGGYRLSQDPAEITFAQVYEAVEGTTLPMDCAHCPTRKTCIAQSTWQELEYLLADYFQNKTLDEFLADPKYNNLLKQLL